MGKSLTRPSIGLCLYKGEGEKRSSITPRAIQLSLGSLTPRQSHSMTIKVHYLVVIPVAPLAILSLPLGVPLWTILLTP